MQMRKCHNGPIAKRIEPIYCFEISGVKISYLIMIEFMPPVHSHFVTNDAKYAFTFICFCLTVVLALNLSHLLVWKTTKFPPFLGGHLLPFLLEREVQYVGCKKIF